MEESALRRLAHPAVILLFLAPILGELLSGSSPPAEFFQPITFVLLMALYGCGALLVRELTFRWSKGWPSVLLLGLAYGIVEEGLAVKSFFDPSWVDLGTLGEYGRWAGVNWVWSLGLMFYHAVYSIGLPILLAWLLFPGWEKRPWLRPKSFRACVVALALVVLFCNLFLTPYRPSWFQLAFAGGAAVGLAWLAHGVPAALPVAPAPTLPRPRGVLLRSFAAAIGLFCTLWALPNTSLPPLATLALMAVWAILLVRTIARLTLNPAWSRVHAHAAASGALLFFILLDPLIQLDPNAPDNRSGMALVALGMALFLIWLGRRLRMTERGATIGQGPEALRVQQGEGT
jgi:hypothetical protein